MPPLPKHLQAVPAGRQKLSREVVEEHQRARILAAAREVFATNGYPATSVDDLVAAAGMGVGSFYGHFTGKEECLLVVYDGIVDEAQGAIAAVVQETADWTEQICFGLQTLLGWIAAQPGLARIALAEIQTAGPPALDRYQVTLDEAANLLKRGRSVAEATHSPPDSLEQTIVSGIAWLLHRRLLLGDTDSIEDLYAELGFLVLEPYLGDEQAKAAAAGSILTAGT